MRRFKRWLRERFLPAWAKDSVCRENAALLDKLERKERELRELRAYVDGLESGLRAVRRVVIQNGVSR